MFQMTKKSKLGPVLETLQNTAADDLESCDVMRRLEELASEQKFAIKFTDMPLKSLSSIFLVYDLNYLDVSRITKLE
jgi:hypothetical protein